MRVLLSSYQCMPNQGSELGNGWHWARALTDHGHEVTVLTQPSHIIDAAAPDDIRFLHAAVPPSPLDRAAGLTGPGEHYRHYLRWQDAALAFVLAGKESYDVTHHVSWGSLHLGSQLWRAPAPLVFGPIGGGQTAPSAYRHYFGRWWPLEWARTTVTRSLMSLNSRSRKTVRGASVTLVTNSATAEAARQLGATDVRPFLAEGLPASWVVPPRQVPDGLPVVLWVGRMMPRKAPLLALESFARLRATMPARFVMAGDGPLLDRVRGDVERLGLHMDVELLGRVPWTEITELYDSSSVFLFTSLRDSSGSQFLEALGRGLPAVALDLHGVGDLDVGPAAVKVPLPAQPDELPTRVGDALRDILTDGSWPERSAAGVSWASAHTWPAKAAAVTEIYDDVLAV
ncbi:glycosyltransferase [Rothia sp. ARF10]|nr:glycosyltransferase [Rothia sp. ARF10]